MPAGINRGKNRLIPPAGINLPTLTRKKEMDHLTETFQRNGYPPRVITHKPKEHPERPKDKPTATVSLPYHRDLSEKIRRICGKYNIRTIFRSNTTLRRTLT